jgi:hypothetical protein
MQFAAGAAALVVLAFAIHFDALDGWWLSDDPQVLLHAMLERPWAVLFDPPAYRYLSTSSFTPLVTISFDADLGLAGVRPSFFYWHQLLALIAAAVLMFALLSRVRTRQAPVAAWIAAAGFLISPAAIHAVRSLMIRHYLEGLVLALCALLLWDLWCEGRRRGALLLAAAALCYLGAMLAKEIYAPLPLLMIWQAWVRRAGARRFLIGLAALSAAAAVYIPWRVVMLGTAGGYGADSALGSMVFAVPRVGATLLGPIPSWAYALAGAVVGLLVFLGAAERRMSAAGFLAAASVFTVLPLAGVTTEFDLRYGFAATVVLFAAGGLAAASGRRELLAALAVVAIIAGIGGWLYERYHERATRLMVAEGRYLWSQPQTAPPLLGTAPAWYFSGISEVRALDDRGRSPSWVLSHEGFILSGISELEAVRAEPATGAIRALDAAERAAVAREHRRFTPAGEIDIQIEMRNNLMRWELGPMGPFAFLSVPQYAKFPIPPSGSRRLPEANERQHFRIRRDLPDGRWTVSPVLVMPGSDGSVRFRREE